MVKDSKYQFVESSQYRWTSESMRSMMGCMLSQSTKQYCLGAHTNWNVQSLELPHMLHWTRHHMDDGHMCDHSSE